MPYLPRTVPSPNSIAPGLNSSLLECPQKGSQHVLFPSDFPPNNCIFFPERACRWLPPPLIWPPDIWPPRGSTTPKGGVSTKNNFRGFFSLITHFSKISPKTIFFGWVEWFFYFIPDLGYLLLTVKTGKAVSSLDGFFMRNHSLNKSWSTSIFLH